MAVSRRLRYEILRRDNHACRYCGATAPDVKLTVDHVVPSTLGGSDDPTNLVTACAGCNAGKSASAPDAALVADVDQKAVQWAQAMNVALERRAAELSAERKRLAKFDRKWKASQFRGREFPRDGNWKNSIVRFLAGGLDDQFLADAAATATGNVKIPVEDAWRYFCGICWRELDKIREMTADVVRAPAAGVDVEPDSDEAELADGFPFMELFSQFLDEVLEGASLDERARKIAHSSLWGSMSVVDKVWRMRSFGDPETDADLQAAWDADPWSEEGSKPSRHWLAREAMSSYVARDMYEISLIVNKLVPSDGS